MKLKPITAIVILLFVVAVSASGCFGGGNDVPRTPTATPSTETHNATLEKFLTAVNNTIHTDKNLTIKAWEVTWINGTSARVQLAEFNKSTNITISGDATYIVFPTTQDATNYLNAMNKTAYSLASTVYESGGNYQKATGHPPQIYKKYAWNEGNPFNISEYKLHQIEQADNIIIIFTGKSLG